MHRGWGNTDGVGDISPRFSTAKCPPKVDTSSCGSNIRRNATDLNALRHAEAGVSGNCRKWSGTVVGFWHTTVLVGPQRRSQLDSSQCLDCCWNVTGNKAAIAIAEKAHICVGRFRATAMQLPAVSGFKTA
jgi:hypothetical protein